MSELRITQGECRTVNVGDRVVQLEQLEDKGEVYRTGRIVGVDWEMPWEKDDGTMTVLQESCGYRVWDLTWSDELQAWTIPYGFMGLGAHELAMGR